LLRKDSDDPVTFTWTNRHSYRSQILEVASDPLFKSIKIKQDLPGTATTTTGALPDGFFYWRVTGFLQVNDKSEALSSPALPFGLSSNWEVKPPRLLAPVHQ